MNVRRIWGVLLQEYYVTIHSLEILVDVFFFPILNIVLFGLISMYLSGSDPEAARNVLLGMVLWQIIWIIAYSVAVESLWNIWSKNLSNMFIAPLKLSEYVIAHFLSGSVKALILLMGAIIFCSFAFGFNVFDIGFSTLFLLFTLFAFFAFTVGLVVLGLIFCYGLRIQALSWSLIFIFQPLSAAFFPLDAMPQWLQAIAYLLPPTYGFEAARFALEHGGVHIQLFATGFILTIMYLIPAVFVFRYLFNRSRNSGQFARNEA
ncbi:MAG TPA: ABC transporter permease [Candidatus Paceibacterota bacterium]